MIDDTNFLLYTLKDYYKYLLNTYQLELLVWSIRI